MDSCITILSNGADEVVFGGIIGTESFITDDGVTAVFMWRGGHRFRVGYGLASPILSTDTYGAMHNDGNRTAIFSLSPMGGPNW